MSDNELSGDDIDALLSAIESGADDETLLEDESCEGPMIRIYDFVRPDLFTKAMLGDIHLKIDSMLSVISQKILAMTAAELPFNIESIDVLSFEEIVRSTPNPCNMIKLSLKSGRIILITADQQLAKTIGSVFLGLSSDAGTGKEDSSFYTELLCSIVEMLYMTFSDKVSTETPEFLAVRDPYTLSPESGLEPVLAVSIAAGESGGLNITLPLTTVIELFPDAMKAFRLTDVKADRWKASGNTPAEDLWFRRIIKFPVYYASLNNIKAALENGGIEMSTELKGRVEYKPN